MNESMALSLADAAHRRISARERLLAALDDAAHALDLLEAEDLKGVSPLDWERLDDRGLWSWADELRAVAARLARANTDDAEMVQKMKEQDGKA